MIDDWYLKLEEVEREIERLEQIVESQNIILTSSTNGRVRKAVIEDMREWGAERTVCCDQDGYDLMAFEGLLDAYAKDRGIK